MDSKKEQIVRAALKRFAHFGFQKTTMNEIAVDLNITKANLYYYYPDKNALIIDVLECIAGSISAKEEELVDGYDGDLLKVINEMLDLRAEYMKEYYVLHLNESMEWVKGEGVANILVELLLKDIAVVNKLFTKAVEYGELQLANIQQAAASFCEIVRGLGLIRSITDIISGMPNPTKVDEILVSQKAAVSLIFSNKLNITQ
ncbi:TetR/AcrR family transcriptional regulator [Sphingobacterium psychroaquaticum]|uniref:Transcriptional regulator, TetR family n=1 Tax=Sphingobacterium psychroaquaticum TaxID=561061 RepID=A0A1X7JN21_9SPHI|nr:TetR/AcrR family transcriptional regulator [Sphingobacterium psychroaquaticum]QBQ40886.1 TetR/AcrR family transcriptional regulator [Sphingobacterium psychroaquaticum]SMG29608.1 transcriptional regulator, TetR family [Sphingobacterium psychroaquaticum]